MPVFVGILRQFPATLVFLDLETWASLTRLDNITVLFLVINQLDVKLPKVPRTGLRRRGSNRICVYERISWGSI
jgi:hypothetical protein